MPRHNSDREGLNSEARTLVSNLGSSVYIIPILLVCLIFFIYSGLTRDMVEPDIFLNQNEKNFYDATATISKKYEDKCLKHLSTIDIPSYIDRYITHNNNLFTTTITVKYGINRENLTKIYYESSDKYYNIVEKLKADGYDTSDL